MSAGLIRDDGIAADHRLPSGSFFLQVSGEELRGVEHRDQGLVLELPGEPRRLHRAHDLGAHALHDRRGRARGRGDAEGAVDLETRKSGLGEGGHFGQLGSMLDDRERDQPSRPDVRERDRGVGKGEAQLPAEKRGHHVADALEGHVQELRARNFRELAGIQVGAAAGRRGHDELDGTRGPGFLRMAGRGVQRQENCGGESESPVHVASSCVGAWHTLRQGAKMLSGTNPVARAVFLFVFGCLASRAGAQTQYPGRMVRAIVPYTPGSSADLIARNLGPRLSENWKVPFVVDNRAGASGIIGVQAVVAAPGDGYTVLIMADNFASAASVRRNAYDPVNDLDPVILLARGDYALMAAGSFPAKSVAELVVAARANPGKIYYASPGSGLPAHLMMEVFKSAMGIDLVHVPYKNNAAAVTDLVAGQVSLLFASP